jgi:pimeloyl-ACP methyl ester carboxylesterase
VEITEERAEVAGLEIHWLRAGEAPVLYLHGVPTDGDIFLPFLARTGGIAPDLPGFGRSGKPAAFDYSIAGYVRFLRALTEAWALERFSLVMHGFGGVGLALAQAMPGRVERLVLIDAIPLLPGYRWHRMARIWRTPLLGELAMGMTTRWTAKQLLRRATAGDTPLPDELLDRHWERFDHGTQRAILKLHRSTPAAALARAGQHLPDIRAPALVVWGEEDPYVPVRFAEAYASALGGPTRVEVVERASHWPWIDRPETVETVARFLAGDASP